MKEFRKNTDNFYICEECEKSFSSLNGLSQHITRYHNQEEYYIKWLMSENDNVCKLDGCNNITKFKSIGQGYNNGCCISCSKKIRIILIEKTLLEKTGYKHPLQNPNILNKMQNKYEEKTGYKNPSQNPEVKKEKIITCKKNYNCDNPSNVPEIRRKAEKTYEEKTGFKFNTQNPDVVEKMKLSNLEKWGHECTLHNPEIHKKVLTTFLEKYNSTNPMSCPDILEKSQKNARKIHKFKDTDLTYQASYELDFLNNFYDKYIIIKGVTSKYMYLNKEHTYHSDFMIPSLNLVIEIKNSYFIKRDKDEIEAKKNSIINSGYNYIIIVDKDYTEFNKLLEEFDMISTI